eukprot:scaffold8580_cov102-Isochrysis_galbana.AAC.2
MEQPTAPAASPRAADALPAALDALKVALAQMVKDELAAQTIELDKQFAAQTAELDKRFAAQTTELKLKLGDAVVATLKSEMATLKDGPAAPISAGLHRVTEVLSEIPRHRRQVAVHGHLPEGVRELVRGSR